MSQTALVDQIEMLRVQLESTLPTPVLLVVSSAREDDGKGIVASGLAHSMDAAGYSTLLVLADEQTREVAAAVEPESLDEVSELGIARYLARASGTSVMPLPNSAIRRGVSRETVARFGAACRTSYRVTIVEAAVLLSNSFAMLASAAADGVLLTIRGGRRVCAEDRRAAQTLAREQAPFLGVVSVAPSVLRQERPRPPEPRLIQVETSLAAANLRASRKEQTV